MNPVEAITLVIFLGISPFAIAWTCRHLKRKFRYEIEAWQDRKKGIQNAKRLAFRSIEICHVCRKATDPEIDIYDVKTKRWWHKRCYQGCTDHSIEEIERDIDKLLGNMANEGERR